METLNYSVSKNICRISLNRPDKRNAIDFDMSDELMEAFGNAGSDNNVLVIVLSGEGSSFSWSTSLLTVLHQNGIGIGAGG